MPCCQAPPSRSILHTAYPLFLIFSFSLTHIEAVAHVRTLADVASTLCELKEVEDRGPHFRFLSSTTLSQLLRASEIAKKAAEEE